MRYATEILPVTSFSTISKIIVKVPVLLYSLKNHQYCSFLRSAKAKTFFEKSEDPKYVDEQNIPVDYKYYFINKFLNPVCASFPGDEARSDRGPSGSLALFSGTVTESPHLVRLHHG